MGERITCLCPSTLYLLAHSKREFDEEKRKKREDPDQISHLKDSRKMHSISSEDSLKFSKILHIYIYEYYIMITCPCNVDSLYPILNSKIGVYRGIHYFLIFALKHELWVLVRTASLMQV